MSTDSPLVTVVTATYNSSATLQCALQSLQMQEFTDFEVWVIGDACTDNSEETVTSFDDERFFWTNLKENSGSQAIPNNEGIRRARGKYIAYLGHDDLWLPWHLSGLIECLETNKADLVHALSVLIGPQGAWGVYGPPPEDKNYRHNHVAPSSLLHTHESVEKTGLWRDARKISLNVDDDFVRRSVQTGNRIVFCQQLSVLKFPSGDWKLYSKKSDFPQTTFLNELISSSANLHDRILVELATELAKNPYKDVTFKDAFKNTMHRIMSDTIYAYGRERWPLDPILRWQFQRIRKRGRKHRGLSD